MNSSLFSIFSWWILKYKVFVKTRAYTHSISLLVKVVRISYYNEDIQIKCWLTNLSPPFSRPLFLQGSPTTIRSNALRILRENFVVHVFFYKKNEPQKPRNLKKMFRKCPASNVWAITFKNAKFCWNFLKVITMITMWELW